MMRTLLSLTVSAALGLFALGCDRGTASNENEIVVGHYASLTGGEANFGIATDNGIKLAIKEINSAGGINGKQVRLITYDTQSKTSEASSAVTKLITQDKVVAVLGEVASGRSIAGGQVAQPGKGRIHLRRIHPRQAENLEHASPPAILVHGDAGGSQRRRHRDRGHDLPRLLHRPVPRRCLREVCDAERLADRGDPL
ncbi:MAG TPA: ABC transporter substrate-binding protein [Tepidisphaeraceae bacterium]|nr:ABC transporter substrate-binding protein [Tepidisphaeraceae bacterium]